MDAHLLYHHPHPLVEVAAVEAVAVEAAAEAVAEVWFSY